MTALLVEATVRTSLVILAGLAVTWALRRRSAAVRHAVLATTMGTAAAVVPLGLLLPSWDLPVGPGPAAEMVTARPSTAVAGADAAVAPGTSPTARRVAWVPAVWAGGVIAASGLLLAGLCRLRWLARRARPLSNPQWARVVADVSRACGLTTRVVLLTSHRAQPPATWGLRAPRVILPAGAEAWNDGRVRAVLAHEFAHVRRRDWAVQLSAEGLRVLCWFNPLVWLACARLRRESELACDDAVLALGLRPDEYACHLLELARQCLPAPPLAAALPMARTSGLERRVVAMLNPELDRRVLSRRGAALTVAALLALSLPIAAARPAQTTPMPLTGSVYDMSGAVLPEVTLTLEDAQGVASDATTDAAGRFEFPVLPAGKYTIRVSLPGFRTLEETFTLARDRDWTRNITMQVGAVRESITVSAARRPARPAAPAAGPTPIRVGGNIRPPMKLKDVRPIYPESMREAGIEGVVPLEAVIARDGSVQSVRVLSASVHPELAQAAVDAVRQWRFAATLLNGTAVDITMTTVVAFRLSD